MPVGYGGIFGYSFGDVLNTWTQMGVFAYVLPFLLIFALVYGILTKTKILGDNKGVNATIGLTVGLLALQFDYVSGFFASIFPYTGMGLAVLLVALILLGLVSGRDGMTVNWIWLAIGVIIFLFVLFRTLIDTYWLAGGYDLVSAAPVFLSLILILGIMALIIWGGGKS